MYSAHGQDSVRETQKKNPHLSAGVYPFIAWAAAYLTAVTLPSVTLHSAYQLCGLGACGPEIKAVPLTGACPKPGLNMVTCSPALTASFKAFLVA